MERFTFMSDGYYAVDGNSCYDDPDENYCGPAIDRLAAYESTGFTPKEVKQLLDEYAFTRQFVIEQDLMWALSKAWLDNK